jgi:hypothetical protein
MLCSRERNGFFISSLTLLLLALTSCARPNYADPSQTLHAEGRTQTANCPFVFKDHHVCAAIEWEKLPTEKETGSLQIRFFTLGTIDLILQTPGLTPNLVLWMPSMGHGSSPVHIEAVGQGTYRASDVFFIMHGEWQLILQLKDGESIAEQAMQTMIR